MVYSITYRKNNETIKLEWIVPTGWGMGAIREAFYCQYSGAHITNIETIL